MRVEPVNLGFSVADAEGVSIRYDGDLYLSFVDWQGHDVAYTFYDVVAFRWGTGSTVATPRDDQSYVVPGSEWLATECRLYEANVDDNCHYVLCFNSYGPTTSKALEVLARRHDVAG
jgi:hypothetical protein